MTKTEKRFKKAFFPAGLFLLLFLIESGASISGTGVYFMYTAKKRIGEIERYTKNYSISLAEAFTEASELAYKTGDYKGLNSLFREKLVEGTVDEAFFVLKDGKIVVHSKKEIQNSLSGNLANDEFAYNLDLIMKPLTVDPGQVHFTDYNIINSRPPFEREERELIKKYFYGNINKTGWLVSRSVYSKGVPAGTVNFIISKDRVYNFIKEHVELSKKILLTALAASAAISLFVSIFVFVRYRSLQNKAYNLGRFISDIKEQPIAVIAAANGDSNKKIEPATLRAMENDIIRNEPESVKTGYISIQVLGDMDSEQFMSDEQVERIMGSSLSPDIPGDSAGLRMEREIKEAIPNVRRSRQDGIH